MIGYHWPPAIWGRFDDRLNANLGQQLADIHRHSGNFRSDMAKFTVAMQQMSVILDHCSTAGGVDDDCI